MYSTNIQIPAMLHVLLADVVEVCGGSQKVIKILNQLGAVASADIHCYQHIRISKGKKCMRFTSTERVLHSQCGQL